jgi:hypothetical protein
MRADTFYAVGVLLGLPRARLDALLDERAQADVEDLEDNLELTIASDAQIVTVTSTIDRQVIRKWVKEFNRLRNEEPR